MRGPRARLARQENRPLRNRLYRSYALFLSLMSRRLTGQFSSWMRSGCPVSSLAVDILARRYSSSDCAPTARTHQIRTHASRPLLRSRLRSDVHPRLSVSGGTRHRVRTLLRAAVVYTPSLKSAVLSRGSRFPRWITLNVTLISGGGGALLVCGATDAVAASLAIGF